MGKTTVRIIVLIWLAWVVIILGYQWMVTTRLEITHPDLAVFWSRTETLPSSNTGKIYLLEPFMNRQMAWDLEYYVGIAAAGSDDPQAGTVVNPRTGQKVIKNYSFFPFYLYVIRIFAWPLTLFGLPPLAVASLAGVLIVSLLYARRSDCPVGYDALVVQIIGKNRIFDRAWALFSILLLGMEASLFAVDMWVG